MDDVIFCFKEKTYFQMYKIQMYRFGVLQQTIKQNLNTTVHRV